MADDAVLFETRDRVAWITLNRPDAVNAINADLSAGPMAALQRVREDEEIRVAVLTGNGRAFCTGADLRTAAASFVQHAERLRVDSAWTSETRASMPPAATPR